MKLATAILSLFGANSGGIAWMLISSRSRHRMTGSVMAFLVEAPIVRGVAHANGVVAGALTKPIKTFNAKTGSWDKA
jgi:hypothetical protein